MLLPPPPSSGANPRHAHLINDDNTAATRRVLVQVASYNYSSGSEHSTNETPDYVRCQWQLHDATVHLADAAPSCTSYQPLPASANAGRLRHPQSRRRRQQQQRGRQTLRQRSHNGDYDADSSDDDEAAARQRRQRNHDDGVTTTRPRRRQRRWQGNVDSKVMSKKRLQRQRQRGNHDSGGDAMTRTAGVILILVESVVVLQYLRINKPMPTCNTTMLLHMENQPHTRTCKTQPVNRRDPRPLPV